MPEMDIVLERVQNKFACIIGELCSEPVVLSKFAIWLDLRLAEYKAKGAISLDCSGESPDPVWLKGHDKSPPVVKTSDDVYGPRSRMRPSMQKRSFETTHSPEPTVYDDEGVVVIKEEASDETADVFPVSIHRVQAGNQNINSRKRSLPESLAQPQDSYSNLHVTPTKIRHLDERVEAEEEVDNQSLMSIIQETEDDNHSSNVSESDFSALRASNPGSSVQARGDNSLTFSPQNSSAPLHYASSPSTSADDSSSVQQMLSFQSTSQGEISFSQQDTPQSADRIRDPRNPIICNVCQKKFTYKSTFTRHLRVHLPNPKPFSCHFCGSKFSRKDYVRDHLTGCREARSAGFLSDGDFSNLNHYIVEEPQK